MHGCFHDEGGHGPIHQLLPIAEPVAAVWRERRGEERKDMKGLKSLWAVCMLILNCLRSQLFAKSGCMILCLFYNCLDVQPVTPLVLSLSSPPKEHMKTINQMTSSMQCVY